MSPIIAQWGGTLLNDAGTPIGKAEIHLIGGHGELVANTHADGSFQFTQVPPRTYQLAVVTRGIGKTYPRALTLSANSANVAVVLSEQGTISVIFQNQQAAAATGGEQLSSQAVSAMPLNKRDFSQLLLLAAGTMTDANGATNFTAAVRHQRPARR